MKNIITFLLAFLITGTLFSQTSNSFRYPLTLGMGLPGVVTGGVLNFRGLTSGSVQVRVPAAAGTGTIFQLPGNNGTVDFVLRTDGNGILTWVAQSGGISFPAAVTSITSDGTNIHFWAGLTELATIPGSSGSTWGSITGTLGNQVDLTTALGLKADLFSPVFLGHPTVPDYVPTSTTINSHPLSSNVALTPSDLSLGNLDNTSDANKPISTLTQSALNAKQATLVSGTTIKTVGGTSLLGAGDIAVGGTGTVTTVGVTTANGVSASTANPTTTPSMTFTLGAITPSSVSSTGNVTGTNLSGTNTGDNATNTLYSGLVGNATHSGDATGSTALTVVKINGTLLSSLATGLLKNETGTGVPSIASPGTDYVIPSGNVATATKLAATKTINGIDFDGSANITVPSNIAPGASGNVMQSNGSVWASGAVSTLGANIIAVPNPSAINFFRSAADNTLVMETAASHLIELGGTTLGINFLTIPNPDLQKHVLINANNTITLQSVAEYKASLALTAGDVGLPLTPNESKATMFTNAALTGTPTAPTAAAATNTTQIATTAFVLANSDSGLEVRVDSIVTVLNDSIEFDTEVFETLEIVGDTTVTAMLGRIIYKTSDSHFYGCVSTTATSTPKWKRIDN